MTATPPSWILLRHGESEANRDDWLAGQFDTILTPHGEEQARTAGRSLLSTSIDRVVCSDLTRARRTYEIATQERARSGTPLPDATFSAALREREIGAWVHASRSQLRQAGAFSCLLDWNGHPPGGESSAQVAARSLNWLATLPAIPGTTLLVAHGGVIRILIGLLEGRPLDEIPYITIDNATPLPCNPPHRTWASIAAAHLPAPGSDRP